MKEIAIFNQMAVACHRISIWSGSRRVHDEDLDQEAVRKLPSSKVHTRGGKKIFNPQRLNVFQTIKKGVERDVFDISVDGPGGRMFPESLITKVETIYIEAEKQFNKELEELLLHYDDWLQEWIAANKKDEHFIRASALSKVDVASKFSFGKEFFKIVPSGIASADSTLQEAASGLGDKLFNEIATAAQSLYKASFMGKVSATTRVLPPIKRMRDKLDSLAFVHGYVTPIVQTIDTVAAKMPAAPGSVEGQDFHALCGVVLLLSDVGLMKSHAKAVMDGEDSTALLQQAGLIEPESEEEAQSALPAESAAETQVEVQSQLSLQVEVEVATEVDVPKPKVPPAIAAAKTGGGWARPVFSM